MNCFHCYYHFSNNKENNSETVGNYFQGYPIFDEHYNFEIYRFCSLNCGLKYIMDSNENLVKKLKNFFDFYTVDSKSLRQALPKERLKVFNGDLSYEEYRKDFICPKIYPIYNDIQSITYDYFPMF